MTNSNIQIHFLPENCTGCRRCQLICTYRTAHAFNLNQARIRIISENHKFAAYFLSDCNFCGQCARACCYEALSIHANRKEPR